MSVHAPSTAQRAFHETGKARGAAALQQPPQAPPSTFDRDYWIGSCEGYRVDGQGGRIGVVEEVQIDPAQPSRTLLSIRAGLLGRRVMLVSSDQIEFIVPRVERIWLRTPPTILSTGAA